VDGASTATDPVEQTPNGGNPDNGDTSGVPKPGPTPPNRGKRKRR
jgi:hypothetical protein